ncbi:phosphonate metabolism transcriptional regulator PhnF [Rhizobium sp. KVB221]|uniref:Phosphonate metabolism transcriptional regulator PhnF n=1 Tax=Rhizobium setariae TaxID=2801340 RepID=A0A936YLX3_9HYPH|nr:phosphonate metabolism transcriptional regulator PhnF [Rhizobium setariae]
MIDRHSGISAWKQIADAISRSVLAGDFDETGMVPPETVLAQRFGVNRHTVRSAIAALVEEGMLSRVQGRGTMIKRREKLVFPIARRARFSEGLAKQANEIAMTVIGSEQSVAPKDVAHALRLSDEELGLRVQIVSFADQQAVSYATAWFSATRFPDMATLIAHHRSVTRAFAEQGVADYIRLSTEVAGRLATAEEASHLRIGAGSVVLEATSVNTDLVQMPIQYSRTIFAADRIALRFDTQ